MPKKSQTQEYQTDQESVEVIAEPAVCPRCGSTKRTRLREISPRRYNDNGCVIRYRTQCLGEIAPLDFSGNPILDENGKPKSFVCGNRYRVRKIVPAKGLQGQDVKNNKGGS